jgi:hypothetical protein
VVSLTQSPSPNSSTNTCVSDPDHCIDHLRQLVQCQGDITPIPTRFRDGIGRNYIDSDRWHTCRDWSSITQWVEKRYTESQKVVAEQTKGRVNWVP